MYGWWLKASSMVESKWVWDVWSAGESKWVWDVWLVVESE
jgi:hypothetical protein